MWVKKHTFGSLSRIFSGFVQDTEILSKKICNFVGEYDKR